MLIYKKTRHELDVALVSGVFIRGKVRKRATDDTVRGTVYGAPANGNPNVDKFLKLNVMLSTYARTDSQGNFALLAIPGKFHVGFRAQNSIDFFSSAPHIGRKESMLPAFQMNFMAEMTVGESGVDEQRVDVLPRRRIEIEVLDRSGKPVSEDNNGILGYNNPGTFSGSSFHAVINPFVRSEVIILYDYITGDAGKIVVTSDDTRVKLQLTPTATIRGRLVDKDGSPVAGAAGSGPELMRKRKHAMLRMGMTFGHRSPTSRGDSKWLASSARLMSLVSLDKTQILAISLEARLFE